MEKPAKSPRFVINGRFLDKPLGGVTRVGREMVRALIAEARETGGPAPVVATTSGAIMPLPEGDRPVRAWRSDWGVELVAGPEGRVGEQVSLPLNYPNATVVSFCNTTPLMSRRSIVWIHDANIFDAPHSYSRAYRLYHKAILAGAIARKFDIVTVSEFSRSRLIAWGAPADRVSVIHNGGDHIQAAPADEGPMAAAGLLGARYVLVVGSRARHKNMPFAINALSEGLDPSIKIAVVGLHQEGPYGAESRLGCGARVVRLPQITDAALRALYAKAACLVLPSKQEGFGLPAAEALFEDTPLVLSDRTSLPEIGGDAALYFDPSDAEALVAQVKQAMDPDVRAHLIAAGRVHREQFRWRASARQLLERQRSCAA